MASTLLLRLRYSQFSYLKDQFVFLLFETVDFLNQSHVFLHDLVVLLCVELGILFKCHSYVLEVSLKVLSLAGVFLVQVTFCRGRCRS